MTVNPLRRAARLLTGRGGNAIVAALTGQIQVTMAGAQLALDMAGGKVPRQDAHTRMGALEHAGDMQRARLVEILGHSLATPADREDLFRLSRSIDDVLDTLRDFVRESDLYRVSDQSRFVPMLEQMINGVESLGGAVADLAERPSRVTQSALRAKKAGGAVCRMYQYETARLFAGDVTAETLKMRELARRLETVGIRLGDAADALADGAMKRWH